MPGSSTNFLRFVYSFKVLNPMPPFITRAKQILNINIYLLYISHLKACHDAIEESIFLLYVPRCPFYARLFPLLVCD
jgi:hypothetical protein